MIVLGVILLVVGFFTNISILWTIGLVVAIIGVVLAVAGRVGHGLGGRRHYF